MSLVIGCDLDGVTCDFNSSYAPLLRDIGLDIPYIDNVTYPNTWYYERAAGATRAEEDNVWETIRASHNFWSSLQPHDGGFEFLTNLNDLDVHSDVDISIYFVTTRAGYKVKAQTEAWLQQHGMEYPTVIISKYKGQVCKALDIDLYIDDKNENCHAVYNEAPKTKCFMLGRPWNAQLPAVPRIDHLNQFMEIIKGSL